MIRDPSEVVAIVREIRECRRVIDDRLDRIRLLSVELRTRVRRTPSTEVPATVNPEQGEKVDTALRRCLPYASAWGRMADLIGHALGRMRAVERQIDSVLEELVEAAPQPVPARSRPKAPPLDTTIEQLYGDLAE